MRKTYRIVFALVGLVAFAAATWQVGYSQGENAETFPTRHTVEGAFLDFYRAIPNPDLVYGYPITDAFTDGDGVRVQYFQRARFELQPGRGVVLTPLGSLLYAPGERPVLAFNRSAADCRDFANGHSVCAVFRDFYEAHGGTAVFGLPISDVEQDGVRRVQYFEYARLEWYPEGSDPVLQVRVGDLGRVFFERQGEDPRLLPPTSFNAIAEVTDLQLHAFSGTAVYEGAGSQAVFIIAQDQTHAPVGGVELQVLIEYPDGRVEAFPAATGPRGFVRVDVPVDPAASGGGDVKISAEIVFSGETRTARTSFWSAP